MFRVAIRQNSTGEIRVYEDKGDWNKEGTEFFWTEGNFGCDCNRGMLFCSVNNESDNNTKCGDTEYDIAYVELPDGQRIEVEESNR